MCLGLASGYVPPKELPTYEVKDVVCDYGVFENGELMDGLILNSRANALLIAEILAADVKHEIHNQAVSGGKWEVVDVHSPVGQETFRCDVCKEYLTKSPSRFCGYCGARVRGIKR